LPYPKQGFILSVNSNLDYWAARSGEDYRLQQESRADGLNNAYEIQEVWLTKFLHDFSGGRKGSQTRLLDYGCGFGRVARVVCELEAVEYFGFDFSRSMTSSFKANPPSRLRSNIDHHVRIADRLDSVFPASEKFDVILSISVLIHNPPAAVTEILERMLERLAPDGVVVLIENAHTAVSALHNFWHNGCWCHSFARYFDGRADVEIVDNFAQRGIYIARAAASRHASRFTYRPTPDAPAETLDLQGILLKGLNRAALNADQLISEWSATAQDHSALVGRVHDLEELTAETPKLRKELSAARSRFLERQQLVEDLGSAVSRAARRSGAASTHNPSAVEPELAPRRSVEWNALQDTRYSHSLPDFGNVLHVFHKEWFGLRAVAGSLPGCKLAIPADADLSTDQLIEIYDAILSGGYQRIVFHGASKNTAILIEFLAHRGFAEIMFAVMQGATAQWDHMPERRAAFDSIAFLRSRKIKGLHFLKRGFSYPVDGLFKPMLFNLSPKLNSNNRIGRLSGLFEKGIVFVPGWSGWRKNVYTNVLAATMAESVRSVWVYAKNIELPEPLSEKLRPQIFMTRESTLKLMAQASLCMNVSLVDCHPMVNIEAQTIGCPCLRGNLYLDALEEHPYIGLTNVADVTSVSEIRDRIEVLLSVPSAELKDLTLDYQQKSDDVACSRYREFLQL